VFEVARRLSAAGEDVAFVGLLDTRMSIVRWPVRAWMRALRSLPGKLRPSVDRLRVWRGAVGMLRVTLRTLVASARYRPASYAGTLTLFPPASGDPELPSLESIWRPHARSVVVIETGGTHATMLAAPHAAAIAAHLSACLRRDESDRLHAPRIA
jgi:thioesterase domain-containing protein